MSREENKKNKERILRQLAAFGSFITRGFEYACRLYPDDIDFLEDNRRKTYDQVKKELTYKLEHA